MTDGGEVDANLMGAASVQPTGKKARNRRPPRAGVAFEHLPMRDGLAPVPAHGHLFPRVGMAADGGLDRAAGSLRRAPGKSEVSAAQWKCPPVIGELPGERVVRPIGLGNDEEP